MYIILVNMPVYANIVPELNWCYQRWNFTLHGAATYCHVYHIVTNRLFKKTDATNISGMSCSVELKKIESRICCSHFGRNLKIKHVNDKLSKCCQSMHFFRAKNWYFDAKFVIIPCRLEKIHLIIEIRQLFWTPSWNEACKYPL